MVRGGRRSGSGRKPGSGRYGEQTKVIRIPVSREEEVKKVLKRRQSPEEWRKNRQEQLEFFEPLMGPAKPVDLYSVSVQAGYPCPVDDSKEGKLDLNHHLIQGNGQDSFFVRVSGDSMIDAGIHDGDLLVVDRQQRVLNGKIVIAVIDGDLTVKRIFMEQNKVILYPENPDFSAIEVSTHNDFMTLGVVTTVIHAL